MQEAVSTESQRAARGVVWLAVWTVAWVASLAVATFVPGMAGEAGPVVGWIAIGLNLAVGAGWIVAHGRYLRGVDDLQRKILMDALAIALGAGLVVGCAAAAANKAGLVPFDVNIGLLTGLMAVVYLVGVAAGTLRYR